MRQSRYAIEVRDESGRLLLYSASTGAFAQLDERAECVWRCSTATTTEAGRFVEDELVRLGLLVECSAEEELAAQQRTFDRTRADCSELTLSFVPTYTCNFRCPYCYELGHNKVKGTMDARMIGAIVAFVQNRFEHEAFGCLHVQWYGGDPSLALDVVEELTGKLVAWCEAHGVGYDAMMLTNANTIGEREADLIARSFVSFVYLTIDGPEDIHNKRRVAANGTNSYRRTLEAARLLQERGIRLAATMNVDKVNMPYYREMSEMLRAEYGIALSVAKLNDYGHFFGTAPFCAPDFDLYTHEEFFQVQLAEFANQPHTAAELRERLRPADRFCTGQLDNYFVIDLLGDVYRCDGYVGEKAHVRFNLFDDEDTWKLRDITFDATRDEQCSACRIMPICQGSCLWERELSGMPCHPLKSTIGDYLLIYRDCLAAEAEAASTADAAGSQPLTILAEPLR